MDLLHSLTLGDVLREHRRNHPQRTAVVDGDHRYTWPEFDDRVNQLASVLSEKGFVEGDRVLWLGQNSFRILECLLAASKLGGALCPANWRQSAEEITRGIIDLAPKVVIWQDAEIGDTVRQARSAFDEAQPDSGIIWIQHDTDDPSDANGYEALVAAGSTRDPEMEVDPASPALLMYTAAFTGKPHAAMLSHNAVLIQDLVMGMMQEISSDYVYLNCGPLFHVATFMTTMATFHFGGTNVFTPRVDAEELCRLIDAEKCTGAFVMGPTINEIIDLNEDGRFNLKSLRTFAGSSRWNEMITIDTSPWATKPAGFGQTEVMGMLTFNAWAGEQLGNVGRTSPMMQLRLLDPEGNEVPPGETGEIAARGPTVMTGYFGNEVETAARQRGGWHHTGDLGRREVDGSITFIGPRTRLIKSAAENIYPAEVEAALQSHDAVREAAVIGIPDRKWDQSVKAIVALHSGAEATSDELIAHVKSKIASYKKPRTIEFVPKLPRLESFAVDYDELDTTYGGGNYPGLG